MDTGADTPQGITSSADRMVGMEHSEVRYFTRYVIPCQLDLLDIEANQFSATITMVNHFDKRWQILSVVLTDNLYSTRHRYSRGDACKYKLPSQLAIYSI